MSAHEGTTVQTAIHNQQIRLLLQGGITVADAVVPIVRPSNSKQMTMFEAIVD